MSQVEGVPEGWELVRIGTPSKDEHWIARDGSVMSGYDCRDRNYSIIRKLETWRPATFNDIGCERARFRENKCEEWSYGKLMGAAYNLDGSLAWKLLTLGRVGWVDICEVCEDAK